MNTNLKPAIWLPRACLLATVAGCAGFFGAQGNTIAKLSAMTSAKVSTLHASLFFATVWIVSSLRINRLKALWRVGPGFKAMRGASGNLLPGGPRARAATGGSAGGAGTSGKS